MRHKQRLVVMLGTAMMAMLPRPAQAYVLSEDELEDTSTAIGVVLRSFGFLFAGDVLEPPYTPSDMSPSAAAIFDSRLYFSHRGPTFKFVVHNQLTFALSSTTAGPLALGRGVSPPRWLPITFRNTQSDGVALASNADWLYAAVSLGPVTVTAGRQPVTFGRGTLWRTMDRVSTFALTEVDREFKPGADALRVDITAAEDTVVTAVAAIGELESNAIDGEVELRGSTFLGRVKQGWDGGELGVTAGFVRYDAVGGVDAVFDFGELDLYGEVAVTRLTAQSMSTPAIIDNTAPAVSALVGASFRPAQSLTVKPELFYNGFGSFKAQNYLASLLSERVAIGEQTNVGRLYSGLIADSELTPITHLVSSAIVNLHDPSALFSAALLHNLAEDVDLVIGGYVPVGRRPDVLTFSAKSEFGAYPFFAFTELKGTL